jgi:hypothetical protein
VRFRAQIIGFRGMEPGWGGFANYNVPAVLALKPFVRSLTDQHHAWLVVAMSSTLAGNLTLVGSVANLIVAERARARQESRCRLAPYCRAGVPCTAIVGSSRCPLMAQSRPACLPAIRLLLGQKQTSSERHSVGDYSARILCALMTVAHRSVSSRTYFAKASGESGRGTRPVFAARSLIAPDARTVFTS